MLKKEGNPTSITPVTVSIGIAFLYETPDLNSFSMLFKIADERMRISKRSGKNSVTARGRLAA